MLYVLDVDGDKNCTVAPGVKDTHTTSINFNNMMCIFVSSFAFLISSAFPPHFLFPPMHYLSTSRYVAICGHGNAHRYIIVNQSVQTLGVRSITGYSGISFILDSFDVGVRYRFMHRRTAILYHTQGNGANELCVVRIPSRITRNEVPPPRNMHTRYSIRYRSCPAWHARCFCADTERKKSTYVVNIVVVYDNIISFSKFVY